jgi:ClpP class serine protease
MKFSFFEIFWILLITLSLWPLFKHKNIERLRYKAIRSIEQKRKSRVITIIHRQELISILGLPLTRYINIEDSEQVLRAIRLTPDQMPIDILLHTPGGLVLASEQIALALKRHPAKVTVFIPHYAMSGGTMITLAADEIVMDPNAVVGPVDPQLGEYRIPDEKARHIAEILSSGAWTHDYPITCEQFQQLGISVSCMLPNETTPNPVNGALQ